jgi:hypothetical protein
MSNYHKLYTPADSAVVFIDHQPQMLFGVASMDLVGTATNLTTAADIAGSYSAASAGLAVAGGAKVATLQNAKGVVLQLQGRQVGFEASLAVSGMTISLK